MSKNKNLSKKIPTGRTVQTRDEFLASGKGIKNIKPEHLQKDDLYRRLGIVDTNKNGDLVVIKLSTKGRHALTDYMSGKSKYNAFVEIENDKGQKIRIDGVKFVENGPKRDLSKKQVNDIKKNCLTNPQTSKSLRKANKRKFRQVKGRT